MEYVEGKPIDQYVREQEWSLDKRIRLFRAVCEAVQYAPGRAVIHLDLKPSNILVKNDGTPKLLDFGISKHLENPEEPAEQTQLRFTPAFAAPEQIRREPVGVYTDVYALGVILYELLAENRPTILNNARRVRLKPLSPVSVSLKSRLPPPIAGQLARRPGAIWMSYRSRRSKRTSTADIIRSLS